MDIGTIASKSVEAYQQPNRTQKTQSANAKEALKQAAAASGRPMITESEEYGKVIGDVKLSDKALEYYKKLKSKFSGMDFVLVSEDAKSAAQKNAASYGNASKTVVLINEEKLEKMATDESYRKKYEGLIASGQKQMQGLSHTVAGFGIEMNSDGTASYFAAVKNASKLQQERIEEKRAEKRAEKKTEAKKAEKEKQKERVEEKHADKKKAEKAADSDDEWMQEDYEMIRANDIESIFNRVSDYSFHMLSDNVQTEAERMVGGSIDFKA